MSIGSSRNRSRKGFTLVELLVVIGIIALLISILLPSLGQCPPRREHRRVRANLRSIIQGMQIYAAQNKGFIPGSMTSGKFLFLDNGGTNPAFPTDNSNCPGIIQNWDWMSPIAKCMGIKFDEGEKWMERLSRFEQLRVAGVFQCPENAFLAGPASFANANPGPGTGGPTVSYNLTLAYCTAALFQLPDNTANAGNVTRTRCGPDANVPKGYSPQLAKIRHSSEKIYIADAAKFSNASQAPNISIALRSDAGEPSPTRDLLPPTPRPGVGSLPRAMEAPAPIAGRCRSATATPSPTARDQHLRLDAGFFDGHVEGMTELDFCDPNLWMPSGSIYNPTGTNTGGATKLVNTKAWPTCWPATARFL